MKWLVACLVLMPLPALADPFTPNLPEGANLTAEETSPTADYRLLSGPYSQEGGAAIQLEGARHDRAWRLRGDQDPSLATFARLRDQVTAAGFSLLYECETEDCGGYDFRYALKLLPEPQMHVDLGDFRYLAARRGADWLALTVSRSSESGFVQITEMTQRDVANVPAGSTGIAALVPAPTTMPAPSTPNGVTDLPARIEADGAVALDDLVFETGSRALDDEEFGSLRGIADYLATRPKARIALVGHTDTTGTLDANITISRQRADAVRARLVERYGVNAKQIEADGAGWLAPRASNRTEEGRLKNRRVDAVLLPDAD